MTDTEVDEGNLLFCLEWLAGCSPDEVIRAVSDWKYATAREKRDIAIRLCAISGRLIEVMAGVGRDKALFILWREQSSSARHDWRSGCCRWGCIHL